VLGLVLKESPWGKFYEQKKKEGHRFYKYANFYNYDEVVALLEQAGFLVETVISTLFQKPGKVKQVGLLLSISEMGHISKRRQSG
jgi:hypothetical protein